jgi:hypothetical protein
VSADDALSPELEAQVEAAVARMNGALAPITRYVAGVSAGFPVAYYVVGLREDDEGRRVGQEFIIEGMTTEQAEHLRDQLSAGLGHSSGPLTIRQELEAKIARAIEELEKPIDLTEVQDTHAGRALWKAVQSDLALEILRGDAE